MIAIFAHQGKGKGSEQWHSRVPLWVCVTHHDFHSLCVYASGYSIISGSCCFSPSCVSIRVHCRISICPHMAQKLLSSLLKFFSQNPRPPIVSTLSGLRLEDIVLELTKVSFVMCLVSAVCKNWLAPSTSFTKPSAVWYYAFSGEKSKLDMSESERSYGFVHCGDMCFCCLLSSVYKSWLHSPTTSHLSPTAQPFTSV